MTSAQSIMILFYDSRRMWGCLTPGRPKNRLQEEASYRRTGPQGEAQLPHPAGACWEMSCPLPGQMGWVWGRQGEGVPGEFGLGALSRVGCEHRNWCLLPAWHSEGRNLARAAGGSWKSGDCDVIALEERIGTLNPRLPILGRHCRGLTDAAALCE